MTEAQKRRAENEVVFKLRNNAMKNVAKMVVPTERNNDLPLNFVCECSNESCTEKIQLTIDQYDSARVSNRYFIVRPGHEQLDLESVKLHGEFYVVEKYEDPPQTDGVLNNTR